MREAHPIVLLEVRDGLLRVEFDLHPIIMHIACILSTVALGEWPSELSNVGSERRLTQTAACGSKTAAGSNVRSTDLLYLWPDAHAGTRLELAQCPLQRGKQRQQVVQLIGPCI